MSKSRPIEWEENVVTGCWEITSHKPMPTGYVTLTRGLTSEQAHRLIYRELFGEIGEDEKIIHLCENRRCINPVHLKKVPSHFPIRKGIPAGRSLYPEEFKRKVAEESRTKTLEQLSEEYGVKPATIWKWIRKYNVKPPEKKHYHDQTKEQILEYAEKHGTTKAAETFGLPRCTINRWKKEKKSGQPVAAHT